MPDHQRYAYAKSVDSVLSTEGKPVNPNYYVPPPPKPPRRFPPNEWGQGELPTDSTTAGNSNSPAYETANNVQKNRILDNDLTTGDEADTSDAELESNVIVPPKLPAKSGVKRRLSAHRRDLIRRPSNIYQQPDLRHPPANPVRRTHSFAYGTPVFLPPGAQSDIDIPCRIFPDPQEFAGYASASEASVRAAQIAPAAFRPRPRPLNHLRPPGWGANRPMRRVSAIHAVPSRRVLPQRTMSQYMPTACHIHSRHYAHPQTPAQGFMREDELLSQSHASQLNNISSLHHAEPIVYYGDGY